MRNPNYHIIQYGIHSSGEPISIGIAPELNTINAQVMFEYLQKHLHQHRLAERCELTTETPEKLLGYTLIRLYGFEGKITAVLTAIESKLHTLGRSAIIDTTPQRLRPDIGIGLFFWKPLEHYNI